MLRDDAGGAQEDFPQPRQPQAHAGPPLAPDHHVRNLRRLEARGRTGCLLPQDHRRPQHGERQVHGPLRRPLLDRPHRPGPGPEREHHRVLQQDVCRALQRTPPRRRQPASRRLPRHGHTPRESADAPTPPQEDVREPGRVHEPLARHDHDHHTAHQAALHHRAGQRRRLQLPQQATAVGGGVRAHSQAQHLHGRLRGRAIHPTPPSRQQLERR
mmetsp:Transcript_61850/g.145458  ORF Transcript_61850/g.145458 Transcript_61850/m.145458 type:complete len:214 (+) Transcript_61850:269-910(+)